MNASIPGPLSPSTLTQTALTVLLVDDDDVFRHGLAESLRDDGVAVLEYAAPDEVPLLSALGRVHVVITDYEMPGGDGLCLADRIHTTNPGVPIVLLTARHGAALRADAAQRPFLSLVYKPVDYTQLRQLLHELAAATRQ
jgi:CheY-like chemotaxis protein